VAGVKYTETQKTQKQAKKSKPNKKEHAAKMQLVHNTPARSGAWLIVIMYLSVPGQKAFHAQTIFDIGVAVPIISSTYIEQYSLLTINQDTPLRINGADGYAIPGAREAFTYSLMLEYKRHFTRETFEVMALDGETDIILPHWWMAKHQPSKFWGKPEEIVLDSKFCKQHCTKVAVQAFSLSLD
jgi:hypothetical protein